jgi:hypothetical protein
MCVTENRSEEPSQNGSHDDESDDNKGSDNDKTSGESRTSEE